MKYEKSDYKMPRKSAEASSDLEYETNTKKFYEENPNFKSLIDKVDAGEITTDKAREILTKQYAE